MPKYSYTAKNLDGDVIKGVYSATDKSAVFSMIRTKNYYPLEVKQVEEAKEKRELELFPKISIKDLSVFCSQFAVVLKAGVPITQALDIIKSQTSDKKLKKIIIDVSESIKQGKSVHEAFSKHAERFPQIFLSMIEMGEVSGSLEISFERLGTTMTKDYKLQQKVKSAMIYPIILSVVAMCVVIFLLIVIVPTFTGLYSSSGAELPLPTRILLSLSDFMSKNFLLLVLSAAFVFVALNMYTHTPPGRLAIDRAKATMPVVGKLLVTVYAARFARSMSTLSATGVPLPNAIEVTAANLDNSFAENGLKTVTDDVNKGRGLYAPLLEMDFFPPMIVHMCRLGEESGTLDNLLSQAADFYETESETAMARLAALVEPCVIVFMGGAVLFIVLSILMPMFGMYSMVG